MGVSTDAILFYGYCWDEEDCDAELAIIDQQYADWETAAKSGDESTCLLDTHCSASCPMPYVAVRTSLTTSNRGCPSEIKSLTLDPTWNTALAEFCTTLGIKIDDKKPAWWLVSDWSE